MNDRKMKKTVDRYIGWVKTRLKEGLSLLVISLAFLYFALQHPIAKSLLGKSKTVAEEDAKDQSNLGGMSPKSEEVAQDLAWTRQLQKVADQGDADAQHNLGVLYYYGKGVEQDYEKARRWLEKAAEQGHASAQYDLGGMFISGKGVEKEPEEARRWWQMAAEQGHAVAQRGLGVLYYYGFGAAEDTQRWWQMSGVQALFRWLYYYGEEVEQDSRQARFWLKMAAEQGDAEAQFLLGLMYAKGKGGAQNAEKARHWWRKAADQGHAQARQELNKLAAEVAGDFN